MSSLSFLVPPSSWSKNILPLVKVYDRFSTVSIWCLRSLEGGNKRPINLLEVQIGTARHSKFGLSFGTYKSSSFELHQPERRRDLVQVLSPSHLTALLSHHCL